MKKHLKEIERLQQIMVQLRHPKTGCPWDIAQTFSSIAPYTIEEAYEVADAIHFGDRSAIRDELGDLLLQVIFHSRIAEEEGSFGLADVAASISNKMIERHPHVFKDKCRPSTSAQKAHWEDIKAKERANKGETKTLDGIARGLPPMLRALKLQKRAARVGFDWSNLTSLLDKLQEEAAELIDELNHPNRKQSKIEDEIGDLLFVAINIARKANVDPETALQKCNNKFIRRFNYIEQHAEKNINNLSLKEMEGYWQEAKALDNDVTTD